MLFTEKIFSELFLSSFYEFLRTILIAKLSINFDFVINCELRVRNIRKCELLLFIVFIIQS